MSMSKVYVYRLRKSSHMSNKTATQCSHIIDAVTVGWPVPCRHSFPSPITPRPNLALESGHIPKNRSNLGDFSFFSGILNDSTCRYKSSAFVALPKHISPGIQIDRGFSSFDLGLRMGLLSFWKGGVPDQTFVESFQKKKNRGLCLY